MNPVSLFCTHILPDIGNHGVAVRGSGNFQNTVQLIRSGKTGNEDNAEAIDNGLHNHAADGNNTALEGNGRAKL